MFAINHAATALLVKKRYPTASLVWVLLSVQLMELLWVLLNFLGIERVTTEDQIRTVADIHLAYMPFSHSIVTMLGVALVAWAFVGKGLARPQLGAAIGLGIASHLFLDLLTHARDIAVAPGMPQPKFGLGLYSRWPATAFVLELSYGVLCWAIWRGNKALLATLVVFNLANISMFFARVPGPESLFPHRPLVLVSLILIQIVVRLFLVGTFGRRPSVSGL